MDEFDILTPTIPRRGGYPYDCGDSSTPRVEMLSTDEVVTIQPNMEYVCPEMAELRVTLGAITDATICNEYHFFFYSGATPTTLSIPATVNQPDGFSVDANMVYEVSILENNMTAMSWEVTA